MFRSLRSLLSARIASLMLALICLSASAQMNAPDSMSSDLQESAQAKLRAPSPRALQCDEKRHGR